MQYISLTPCFSHSLGTFMEMDQHSGGKLDGIYQDVVTTAGSYYKLSFYMRARGKNLASDDEELIVEWNGVQISSDGYNNKKEGDWTLVEIVVRGTGSDRLTLRESSTPAANDGTGPFLDEVSLVLLPWKTNLLKNSSFEENTVPAGKWRVISAASLKGWTALNPKFGIELWGNGHRDVKAAKGNGETFAELDLYAARGTDGFYQEIQTKKDTMYLLTFFVRARRHNVVSNDEAVVVEWNGVKPSHIGYHAAGEGVWTYIEVMLKGTGGVDQLKFRESVTRSANNGYGALLDEVSLIEL